MSGFIVLTSAQATGLRAILRAINAFPRREEPVIHTRRGGVVTYNLTTTEAVSVRKHPKLDLYAVKITPALRQLWRDYQDGSLLPAIKARIDALTDAQRLAIRNAIRDAVAELDDTWKSSGIIGQ